MTGPAVTGPRRRAKIVCTMGPAVAGPDLVAALVRSGMDVARLNFSHGTHHEHARFYEQVRAAAEAAGTAVGVLADLQGPKIRLGRFDGGTATWEAGDHVTLAPGDAVGTRERVATSYAGLAGDVRPGDRLLVDDGNLVLAVETVTGAEIGCRVVEGGPVGDHKGVSLPGIDASLGSLSEKDLEDLALALALGVDMVALSFVRTAGDVEGARQVMARLGGERVGLIAKVETAQAVRNLPAIVEACDGIMVARGDLGVETAFEEVPYVQKHAVAMAREAGKPVIVATQLLESMTSRPRPTRAEASDVANAVLDGADALMLSAETGVGSHPVAAVQTMDRIVRAVEASDLVAPFPLPGSPGPAPGLAPGQAPGEAPGATAYLPPGQPSESRSSAICRAAVGLAVAIDAAAVVAFTQTGGTARRLARSRPPQPLLALAPDPRVRRQLSVSWGVETFVVPPATSTDHMVQQVDDVLLAEGRVAPGASVVVVAGVPSGRSGSTDTIRVHRMGMAGGPEGPGPG